MRLPPSLAAALALSGIALGGCGDDDGGLGSGDLVFGPQGSISEPSGKGSFRFGAASAATQIEDMNPNTDWYVFTRPAAEGGLGNGTFVGNAAGGYTRAIDDVKLLTDAHLDTYRFSIEWSRIEPRRNEIDEAALDHYSKLLDALVAAKIRPVITIHHFSNPVWIDDPRDTGCSKGPSDTNLCGLGHPTGGAQVVKEMAEHAKLLATRFGDRVDEWGTLNEPVNYLVAAYGVGQFPPGKFKASSLLTEFVPVVRDFLAAHAAMYAAIKAADTVDADGDGQPAAVGLTLNVADWQPAYNNVVSKDPADVTARDRIIYVYHHLVVDALTAGRFDANLDGTLDEDQPAWKDTLDWLGVQYYFRAGVTGRPGILPVIEATPCAGGFDLGACLPPTDATWCVPTMGYEFYADGVRTVLEDLGKRHPEIPMIVSESGIATEVGPRRAENIVRTLEAIALARKNGIDVRGYYHWSLFDNFEWSEGFVPRFGLYHVDYASFSRTPTDGATVLADIATSHKVTAAQRKQYGGDGPMTPEPSVPSNATACPKIH